MNQLLEYKCPCCSGSIKFDSGIQKMKCPYCDTQFDIDTLKGYDEDLKESQEEEVHWENDSNATWSDSDIDGVSVYVCDSCGGEVICDNTTSATHCPYCDNPIIVKGRVSGDLRPDFVIPFKLDKKAAKEAFAKHLQKKPLLPKVFKSENHIDEIKGIYVPFWLYDASTEVEARYRATRVHCYSTANYHCTKTSYFSVTRAGKLSFAHVPVDGSTKMADDLMESVEPFDFSEAVDFKTAYLSGYLADRYDVSMEDSRNRATERIKRSAEDTFRETVVGYSTVRTEYSNVKMKNPKSKYVLYPVWLLNTTWRDKKFVFAMNGQTGKFVGNLPVDWGAYFKHLLIGTGIFGLASFAILCLIELLS